jgi:hypothetical protein
VSVVFIYDNVFDLFFNVCFLVGKGRGGLKTATKAFSSKYGRSFIEGILHP